MTHTYVHAHHSSGPPPHLEAVVGMGSYLIYQVRPIIVGSIAADRSIDRSTFSHVHTA